MSTSHQQNYAELSDEELLRIAAHRHELISDDIYALDGEMQKRGLAYLNYDQAQQLKKSIDGRTWTAKKRKSYWSDSPKMYLAALIWIVIFALYAFFVPSHLKLPDEWEEPAAAALMGLSFALVLFRPLWKEAAFWVALICSCAAQGYVCHSWLLQFSHRPSRGEGRLVWLGSLVAGFVVGMVVYKLCESVLPHEQEDENPWGQ